MNYEESKPLAEWLNTKMSYARQHEKDTLPIFQEFADEIAKLFTYSVDRKDWYGLLHYASRPQE